MNLPNTIAELFGTLPERGTLRSIGLRPERRVGIRIVDHAALSLMHGAP